jgi:hypothetical protein
MAKKKQHNPYALLSAWETAGISFDSIRTNAQGVVKHTTAALDALKRPTTTKELIIHLKRAQSNAEGILTVVGEQTLWDTEAGFEVKHRNRQTPIG